MRRAALAFAVGAPLGAGGCLAVPTPSGDGGAVDRADARAVELPPPDLLDMPLPIAAVADGAGSPDDAIDLYVIGGPSRDQLAVVRGPDLAADPLIDIGRQAFDLQYTSAIVGAGGEALQGLVFATRADDGELRVQALIGNATDLVGAPDCALPGAPVVAPDAEVRIGATPIDGEVRIAVRTPTDAWLSSPFDGTSCPTWPTGVGIAEGDVALRVAGVGDRLAAIGTAGVLFLGAGGSDTVVLGGVRAGAVGLLGEEPAVLAAAADGLYRVDPLSPIALDDAGLADAVDVAAGQLDGGGAGDLLVLSAAGAGSIATGYRALSAGSATEPCQPGQAGASCALALPERYDFAVPLRRDSGATDAVLVIAVDGTYRCLAMEGGQLGPCSE